MSTIPAFIVGVVVSQAGYVYLSDHIVQPRNRVIQRHFNRDGVPATYEPDHAAGIRRYLRPLVNVLSGEQSNGTTVSSLPRGLPSPGSKDHEIVTGVHRAWNGFIISTVNKLAGVIYGDGGQAKDAAASPASVDDPDRK